MISLKDKSPKILVIGDLMIDHYLWGSCSRISPEAPVQIVSIDRETTSLGGAGNVLNNLKEFGITPDIISVIGDDENSNIIKTLLQDISISIDNIIIEDKRITSKKSRVIASHQQVIRYDSETTENISKDTQERIIELCRETISLYDVIILSDYDKGVLTPYLTKSIIRIANNLNIKLLVDPKGDDYSKYYGAYLLTPNRREAIIATGVDIIDKKSLEDALLKLKDIANLTVSLITLSEDGIALYDGSLREHPTVAKEIFDVTGAGDTVIASLAFALASGYNIDSSVEFANLSAGVVLGKIGSSTATLDEVIEYASTLHKSTSDFHIKTHKEIEILTKELKVRGKKIIFTNGCFDILHIGHIKYLEEAKSYGDILIVGVNSDDSVRRLKGESRPINSEDDRAYILASLEAVDYVVKFTEDTPYNLIRAIEPDILVKGGDYEGKDVVGQDIAKELRLVQFVDGKSTTKIIAKIGEIS